MHLDDKTEARLPLCDGAEVGQNNLHGGPKGFSRQNWTVGWEDFVIAMSHLISSPRCWTWM